MASVDSVDKTLRILARESAAPRCPEPRSATANR